MKVLSEPVSSTADGNVQLAEGYSTYKCSKNNRQFFFGRSRLKLITGVLAIEPDRRAQPCPAPPCVPVIAVVSTKPLLLKNSRQQ